MGAAEYMQAPRPAPAQAATVARQEHVRSPQELAEFAEAESQSLLGVSWDEARRLLESGELDGTAAEAEVRMIAFLISA
jgi:hypothetical protein